MKRIYSDCVMVFGTLVTGTGKDRKPRDALFVTAWDHKTLRFKCGVPLPDACRANHMGFSGGPDPFYQVLQRLVTSVETLYLPLSTMDPRVVEELTNILSVTSVLDWTKCARAM